MMEYFDDKKLYNCPVNPDLFFIFILKKIRSLTFLYSVLVWTS